MQANQADAVRQLKSKSNLKRNKGIDKNLNQSNSSINTNIIIFHGK